MKEVWKDFAGYEGFYQASSGGEVKRLIGICCKKERVLRKNDIVSGYIRISLIKNGKRKRILLHRIILLAFKGPCPKGMEGCHIDGNKLNNNINNLKYATRSENALDKISHGTMVLPDNKGSKSGMAKSNELQIKEIKILIKEKILTQNQIAHKFNLSPQTICDIKKERTWKHIKV
jgi:DNA-binding XRE family transcriptional regulator